LKYKTSYMKTKVIKIYYYKGNNFGDELGPYIVTQLSGLKTQYKEIVVSPLRMVLRIIKNIIHFRFYYLKQIKSISFDKKVLVPIGSTIARGNKKTTFWGNGFLNKKESFKGGKIYAVRGKYTDEKLRKDGFKGCSVYGDPALLLPIIYPIHNRCIKRNEIGIIPHYLDLPYFQANYSNKYKIIDLTTNNVEGIISEICSCKKILSTSLHGIIVAQAYDIPALWIKKNDIGTDGFKFHDYFSSVEIPQYEGFSNISEILRSSESINTLFNENKNLTKIQVNLIDLQRNLIKVAPFNVLDKFKNI
jgi:pyruvyltransferase